LLAAAAASVGVGRERVKTAIVFAAGAHAARAADVAKGAAEHLPQATVIAIGGAGALAPDAEVQGSPGVTALALPCPVRVEAIGDGRHESSLRAQVAAVAERLGKPSRPVFLFARPGAGSGLLLNALDQALGGSVVAGAGIAPDGTIATITPESGCVEASALAVRLDGGLRVVVGAASSAKPISDWFTVDRVERGSVRSLAGSPPLERLTRAVASRNDRPLVLGLLRRGDSQVPIVRAITGIDPPSGSIHVGDPVRAGDSFAFGVLDADHARSEMTAMLRRLRTELRGGTALAGIFLDCAGRGQPLYGRPRVDIKAIASHVEGVPFAGMRSSFEIARFGDRASICAYTGVLALLYAPS
jgi:small ligand-binding sensory domain FIST